MLPIVLCGPTASGKTELALALARLTGGRILSADSRQVYQRLTIGTAKPQGVWENKEYLVERVPYDLVDFLPVTDSFNAASFCTHVERVRKEHPSSPLIFAGGTGLYLHAYFVGLDPLPAGTEQTRTQLTALLEEKGKAGLHAALQEKDPVSAAAIPMGNVQRTMRALELCLLTGRPASTLKSGRFFQLPDTNALWCYLDWEKETLAVRIQTRTEAIFDGMCTEAQQLLDEGYTPDIPALKTLGYPQAIAFLHGELSRSAALERICTLTRQYAKRQRTWFNRYTNTYRIPLQSAEDFDVQKIARDILSRAQ